MVCVIKDTAAIYCFFFARIDMTQRKNSSDFLETILEIPAFSFKAVENFSYSKPRPSGQGENPRQ